MKDNLMVTETFAAKPSVSFTDNDKGSVLLQVVVAAVTWIPRGGGPSEPPPLVTASAEAITRGSSFIISPP